MLSREAMATRFEIILCGADSVYLRAAGEEALEEIGRVERQLSRFEAMSEISGVNARAAREAVRVNPRLFSLLVQARQLWQDTDGTFDITVAPLMRAWRLIEGGKIPDPDELDAARAITGMQHVIWDESSFSVRFDTRGVEFDLGGIGKGYAIDRAVNLLTTSGISTALIHGGTSTVFGIGCRESGPWRVGIQNPLTQGKLLGQVELQDKALSVSSTQGRFFTENGVDYGHVIDPRNGEPARNVLLAAVTGPSATVCDALSTALLVLGQEWLPELTQRFTGYGGLVAFCGGEGFEVGVDGFTLVEG